MTDIEMERLVDVLVRRLEPVIERLLSDVVEIETKTQLTLILKSVGDDIRDKLHTVAKEI